MLHYKGLWHLLWRHDELAEPTLHLKGARVCTTPVYKCLWPIKLARDGSHARKELRKLLMLM